MGPDDPSTELLPPQAPKSATPQTSAALPTLVGRVLGGRFTIVEQLGKGGSGEVYRADQAQLGRSAVIKVLRRDVAIAANRVERFLREAKLASRLDHPYAAHIYAFGAEADNVLWIAMEHVKGITLDDLIVKRGAMPANLFAPLFARLCEVVHTAHELGIVHRDIKGANVMVIERAGQLLPKLLDFGIAKSDGSTVGSPGTEDSELTGHGATLGSPHYMSPEQWVRPADVDARADIYALGVLAYRCLAGHLPFHTTVRAQLAEAHTSQPVPPPPDFVSAPLVDAVMRALEKDPDRRWPTAVAFAAAIQRTVGTTVTEAVPIVDAATRDAWLRAGPQPIADAVAHLTSATTTVEADGALRDLVAITCRWLAVLALAGLPTDVPAGDTRVRERARGVAGRDDGAPWIALAQAAVAATLVPLPALVAALATSDRLAALAARLDERDRARTAAALAADIATIAEALMALEPLLAYHLVLGCSDGTAESWQGQRRRERERVLVWGPALAPGDVALLDAGGHVVARLSPFAQVLAPLPAAEPELFLLWRSGRGGARLMAAPWGFERDDERAAHLLAALSTEDSDTSLDDGERSPYPGLAAYGVGDADHFVGREREVEALTNRLVRSPLVAVLGPSGVGKSSFIHAGLVARLGDSHRVLTMRPGRHPMHALAALPPVSGDSHDDAALVLRLRELGDSAQRGLVLVVDQLEELVTLCADPTERTRFAETLAAAADGPGAPVRIVATLRDDFATVLEGEAALRGQFDVFVLAAPPPEALRRIVVEPARRANVTVDPRVVDDMVATVAGRPASLPLLSFTAAQLWQTRDRAARKITYEAYQELGGVAGALATYADEIYGSLARRDQDTVRDLFSRLVAADGTRIPSARRELEELPGARGVLAHLIDARLLVVRDDDGPNGDDTVELVHECLAERWPRLARWRTEEAADRAMLADVRAASRRWHDGGRAPDLLWRGDAVSELGRLAARSSALTDLERAFAAAGLRAQQRTRRIRRGIAVAVMAVLASTAGVMAYLSIAANESRADAERSAAIAAESAQLAEERLTASLLAQGRRELNDSRALPALAYFAAALERGADSQGLRAMIAIAARGFRDVLVTHRGPTTAGLVGSPAGWLAAGDTDGVMRWWSDRGALLGTVTPDLGPISHVELVGTDNLIVAGQRGIVQLDGARQIVRRIATTVSPWFARSGPRPGEVTALSPGLIQVYGADGTERRRFVIQAPALGNEPVFTSGGRHALVTGNDQLQQVDLITMTAKVVSARAAAAPTVSADGSRWLYVDRDLVVHLHDGTGKLIRDISKGKRPLGIAVSASGDRIGLADEREMRIFDGAGKTLGTLTLEPDQSMFVLRDDDVWTGGTDGTIRHYRDGELIASSPVTPAEVFGLVIAGNALGVVASDSTLVIARADTAQLVYDSEICERVSYAAYGPSVGYECGDTVKLYRGREHLADYPVSETELGVDVHAASHRAVVTGGRGTRVFERATLIAETPKPGRAVFADADHLYFADEERGVWRWTLTGDRWERLIELSEPRTKEARFTRADEIDSLAALGERVVLGLNDGTLVVVAGTREERRLPLGAPITSIVPAWDGRWLAVQLGTGGSSIIDTRTWQVVRTLAPGDNYGAAPSFDASGDLLLRTSRQSLAIWDATTGDELVFGFDLMRQVVNARFLPDGRIELNQRQPGLLDIPRDVRPVAQILGEIRCKVPLRVVDARIEPASPTCQ